MRILGVLMLLLGIGTTSNVCGQLVFESDTTTLDVNVMNLEDTLPFFGKFAGVTWLGDTTVKLNWRRINTE